MYFRWLKFTFFSYQQIFHRIEEFSVIQFLTNLSMFTLKYKSESGSYVPNPWRTLYIRVAIKDE